MAFPQGIDFRNTAGYVTDPTDHTYEDGTAGSGPNYPRTSAQGNNVGWEVTQGGGIQPRDRNAGNDARIAGCHLTGAAGNSDYRLDLPAAGDYSIGLAAGEATYARLVTIDLYDTNSSLGSLSTGSTSAAQRYKDATNTEYTQVTWPTSQTLVTKTFATTICRFRVIGNNCAIAHVYVAAAAVATPKMRRLPIHIGALPPVAWPFMLLGSSLEWLRARKNLLRMFLLIMLVSLAMVVAAHSQAIAITPSTPPTAIVNQQIDFDANVAVTWSCPGCAGSINSSTGVYTAPSSITSKASLGGYQLLPNDHVLNTAINGLSVEANSTTRIGNAGTQTFKYLDGYPLNYLNGSTPTAAMTFFYTTANDGTFQIPAYPGIKIENGILSPAFGGDDRHLLGIDTTTGTVQEMYNYYTAGTNGSCALCTSQSGVRYSNSTYALPVSGATTAAGTAILPLLLRLQELEDAVRTSGTIKHALMMTLQSAFIADNAHVWPATVDCFSCGGTSANNLRYGERIRLKAAYNISGYSAIAQILLTQLKQYGMILTDAGNGWQVTVENTKWPAAYLAALTEVTNAGLAPSEFEVVDESSLMLDVASGQPPTSEIVVATRVASPFDTVSKAVILTGVTINLPSDTKYIQANTAAQQLTSFIQGGATNTATWAMSPTVGTLTSGGLYTPPASVTDATVTVVTATAVDDTTRRASMTLTVFPTGIIYMRPNAPSQFTDSGSHKWEPYGGDSGSLGCCGNLSGGGWPAVTDIQRYYFRTRTDGSDIHFDTYVPNGIYQITALVGTDQASPGGTISTFEAQGVVQYLSKDIFTEAGGDFEPVDFVLNTTVTNNLLSFVLRHTTYNSVGIINAVKIEKTADLPLPLVAPGTVMHLGVTVR